MNKKKKSQAVCILPLETERKSIYIKSNDCPDAWLIDDTIICLPTFLKNTSMGRFSLTKMLLNCTNKFYIQVGPNNSKYHHDFNLIFYGVFLLGWTMISVLSLSLKKKSLKKVF